ncbi:tripartite tricarboxylate transporter TctB family protein [Hansschlegelia sp. KR7-227]|uniref:tripartite tricarboxylate transporter TctB family protein n=1 Tax=Hansschlegelia sp. KR7-227 TaxID=3400914 RepID=UPI003C123FA2
MSSLSLWRLRAAAPYLAAFAAAVWLWTLTQDLDLSMSGDRAGPDLWPKMILLVMLGAAALGALQALLGAPGDGSLRDQLTSAPDGAEVEAGETARPSTARLLAAVGLLLVFPLVIEWTGFLALTAVTLFAQMWIGGYRKPGTAAVIAVVGAAILFFLFQRVVYLSLPLGVGPFADLTHVAMSLFGVR